MNNDLEEIIEKLEYILEADPRTIRNPECENSEMFDMAYKLLKIAKSLEKIVKERIKSEAEKVGLTSAHMFAW